ncbi:hypothetical protein J1614_007653, partial [Plenodomus biglobosus]
MMIWKPTTLAVNDTQQALSQLEFSEAEIQDQLRSSYHPDSCMSVLPSVEVSTTTPFRVEKQFPSTTRSLSEQCNNNLFSSESLDFTPSSSALLGCSWHDQLEAFAASGNSTSTLAKPPNTSVSCNAGYASDSTDRTDFFPGSPCPGVRTLQITSKSQKGFRVKAAMKSDSVVRRLDFGSKVTNSTTTDIGALERSPRHGWTSSERIFLCTIFRWYERDTHAFAQIFNTVHNLELPMHKIRDQFECYIRLHGGRAVPEYHQVFEATQFSDLTGRYMLVRKRIEETARLLGIQIRLLEHEVTSPSGEAARAKSALTRRRHRALLKISKRKAAARTVPTADNDNNDNNIITKSLTAVQGTAAVPLTVGGFSFATSDPQDMFLSDAEDSVPMAIEGRPMVHDNPPCLLFRVWDTSSRTLFGPDGFISSGFVEWTDIPPPIPPNDPHEAFKLLAHLHLSRVGDTPCFIAAAESLIQVLTIAANLHEPKIAIIDLRAPCMQQDHKTHLASATLKWLKKDGKIKLRYRYQGHGDWFSYATIPKEAILKHFKLEDLHDTCSHDSAAARLMNLEAFHPGLKTREVASAMRDRKNVLNTGVASAIGRLANLFLGNTRASTQHISAFVARMVDGCYIEKNEATDMHSMSSMAGAFATNFGLHKGCSHQQIMAAFLDGVECGIERAAYWSRSGSGSRRKKTT